MPPDGTAEGFYDPPALKAYKGALRQFKKKGWDFQGHINYNPKTGAIYSMTPEGQERLQILIKEHQEREATKKKDEPTK